MSRNQYPVALIFLAATASYRLSLTTIPMLERFGIHDPYGLAVILTGITIATIWGRCTWGFWHRYGVQDHSSSQENTFTLLACFNNSG
jgi:hypothetical protein